MKRPKFAALSDFVREGDAMICHRMDRLGHNLVALSRTITERTTRKIGVCFVKEHPVLTGDDPPSAKPLLNMVSPFAAFELAWSRERQSDEIDVTKRTGV